MSCKWSHLKVGYKIDLSAGESVPMCDACGGPAEATGATSTLVYEGHQKFTRYGTCDKFRYTKPQVCISCGATNEYWLDPCEDGLYHPAFEEKKEELAQELFDIPVLVEK